MSPPARARADAAAKARADSEAATKPKRRSRPRRWIEKETGRLRTIRVELQGGDARRLSVAARRMLVLIAARPDVTRSRKWTTAKTARVTVDVDQLRRHFHRWSASVARAALTLKARLAVAEQEREAAASMSPSRRRCGLRSAMRRTASHVQASRIQRPPTRSSATRCETRNRPSGARPRSAASTALTSGSRRSRAAYPANRSSSAGIQNLVVAVVLNYHRVAIPVEREPVGPVDSGFKDAWPVVDPVDVKAVVVRIDSQLSNALEDLCLHFRRLLSQRPL